MKDKESVHKKVQEMCDCYAAADPLKEMSAMGGDADTGEAAVKWLALAALHGVSHNAEKITVYRNGDGKVSVTATYRTADLPSPGADVGSRIFESIRSMTHIDGDKGKSALALGIRDSSIDLEVKVKKKERSEKITIRFPEG